MANDEAERAWKANEYVDASMPHSRPLMAKMMFVAGFEAARRTPPPATAELVKALGQMCRPYLTDYSDIVIHMKAKDIRAILAEQAKGGRGGE